MSVVGVYDTIDAHLSSAADIGQASVPMGMLLAWCANMHLLSSDTVREHEQLILRIRFQEVFGSALLVACGGELKRGLFNDSGQAFLDKYYAQYMQDYDSLFGPQTYEVEESWPNYHKIATVLTKAYMTPKKSGPGVFAKLSRWLGR